jgi:hypothetical protein
MMSIAILGVILALVYIWTLALMKVASDADEWLEQHNLNRRKRQR